jgi:hypothetical protein
MDPCKPTETPILGDRCFLKVDPTSGVFVSGAIDPIESIQEENAFPYLMAIMEFKNFIKNHAGFKSERDFNKYVKSSFEDIKKAAFEEAGKAGKAAGKGKTGEKRKKIKGHPINSFYAKSKHSRDTIIRRTRDAFNLGQRLYNDGYEDALLKFINSLPPEKRQLNLLVTERSQRKELDALMAKGKDLLNKELLASGRYHEALLVHDWKIDYELTTEQGVRLQMPERLRSEMHRLDVRELCRDVDTHFVKRLIVCKGDICRLTSNAYAWVSNYSLMTAKECADSKTTDPKLRMRPENCGDLVYHNDVEVKLETQTFPIPHSKLPPAAKDILKKGQRLVAKITQFPLLYPTTIMTSVVGGLHLPGGVLLSNTHSMQPGAGYVALSRVRAAEQFCMLHKPKDKEEANRHDFHPHRACVTLENYIDHILGHNDSGSFIGDFCVEIRDRVRGKYDTNPTFTYGIHQYALYK